MAESSALKALQEKLFARRSELMAAFQQHDLYNTGKITQMNDLLANITAHSFSILLFPFSFRSCSFTGRISTNEWAQVVESVLRLDLPWRTLRPHLVRLASDGNVEYESCFENIGPGQPMPQVLHLVTSVLFKQKIKMTCFINIFSNDMNIPHIMVR